MNITIFIASSLADPFKRKRTHIYHKPLACFTVDTMFFKRKRWPFLQNLRLAIIYNNNNNNNKLYS